jgi:hypothetical protein
MHPGLAKQLNKLARSIDILPKVFPALEGAANQAEEPWKVLPGLLPPIKF